MNIVDSSLWIEYFLQYKLPMADSIIYATAQIYNAEIYTQDKHFENLKQVRYFAKKVIPIP